MIENSLNLAVWEQLIKGMPINRLALKSNDGRIDLRGFKLPDPLKSEPFKFRNIRCVKWENLDFAGAVLNGLRLFDCELVNCRFDQCQLHDLRAWKTSFTKCSFVGADLKKAALGGVQNGERNIFLEVDFSHADLRRTTYKAAIFQKCAFRDSRLEKLDFQSSVFTDCIFEGEIRDVLFYRRGFEGESLPPNEMTNVDFRQSTMRHVGFRGLTLDSVRLPENVEHIVINNVPVTLDKLIRGLKQQNDLSSRKLMAYLSVIRKWAPSNQMRGVLNVNDLIEIGGPEGLSRVQSLLKSS